MQTLRENLTCSADSISIHFKSLQTISIEQISFQTITNHFNRADSISIYYNPFQSVSIVLKLQVAPMLAPSFYPQPTQIPLEKSEEELFQQKEIVPILANFFKEKSFQLEEIIPTRRNFPIEENHSNQKKSFQLEEISVQREILRIGMNPSDWNEFPYREKSFQLE